MGIGYLVEVNHESTDSFNFKFGMLLVLYLSFQWGKKALWDPIIEEVEEKLLSWKRQYLSLSGRITLINVSLSNPLMFSMSFCRSSGG